MSLYDAENVIRDLEVLYKAQLNAEVAIVNADKNDSITLADIPTDTYIFETLWDKTNNLKGYWFQYGLVDNDPQEAQVNNFEENITVTLQVATIDNGGKNLDEVLYRLLRYQRAIKQVILKNSDVFQGYSKPLVRSLKPTALPLDNRRVILSMGIDVIASITAN